MEELKGFVENLISKYSVYAEMNIYERSGSADEDLKELDNECEKLRQEFNEMLTKL